MLRALLIALGLVAATLSGYLYWLHRTRAYLHLRSLSASHARHADHSTPQTRMLHVPGCEREFLVKVGELVQPQITPSASPEMVHLADSLYGPPVHRKHPSALIWTQDAFTLTEPRSPSSAATLVLAMHTGHVVQTLDDIELGIDSFNAIRAKMRDRNLPVTDTLIHGKDIHGKNSWTYRITIPSSCGTQWVSTYARTLPDTAALDAQILPAANSADRSPRPAAFLNRLADTYTLMRAPAASATTH